MKQKIEWYQEVLALEPSSRVFFPLARLLIEEGLFTKAIATLQQGVLVHPYHIEARLLLIDCFYVQDDVVSAHHESVQVSNILAVYPNFWIAWSGVLENVPHMHDASLALRFFVSAMQGQPVSWGSIIEHGLAAITGQEPSKKSVVPPTATPIITPTPLHVSTPKPAEKKQMTLTLSAIETPKHLLNAQQPQVQKTTFIPPLPEIHESTTEDVTLRTRSMANVLAEQGDYVGAKEIYQELLQNATGEERLELENNLHKILALSTNPSVEKQETSNQPNRLADLIESLAQRLENRAR